jgi:propionyl-CoA synthetase
MGAENDARSITAPEGLWLDATAGIDWKQRPRQVPDLSPAPITGGSPTACSTHVSTRLHVAAGHGERAALIHDSPVAGVLANLAVGKAIGVVIYLPMVPRALVAMRACARIGAIHSVWSSAVRSQ